MIGHIKKSQLVPLKEALAARDDAMKQLNQQKTSEGVDINKKPTVKRDFIVGQHMHLTS